jgi:hypothetical protein
LGEGILVAAPRLAAINILAALAVGFWATPAAGIVTLLAIPTLPWALLRHYRRSAEAQPAAVVTNGPQMVYPAGSRRSR